MNEQAFDDLYKEFVRTGYRKSKEDFKILMSTNLDAFTDGFNQFVNTGYNGDEAAFAELIGVEVPVKKKEETQDASTDLLLAGGSLEPVESSDPDPYIVPVEDPQTQSDSTFNEYADYLNTYQGTPEFDQSKADSLSNASVSQQFQEATKGYQENFEKYGFYGPPVVGNDTREDNYEAPSIGMYPDEVTLNRYYAQQVADMNTTLSNIAAEEPKLQEQIHNEQLVLQQQQDIDAALNAQIIEEEGFKKALATIDSSLIDQEEEEVVPFLTSQFKGYGFIFQETGIGDSMIVSAPNGKTITIDLDPFTSATEVAESQKLRDFMLSNATLKPSAPISGEVQNAMRAKQIRPTYRLNWDGSVSTHKFASYEEDGKFKVIPTIFPSSTNPADMTTNSEDWIEPFRFSEAKAEAEKRGEVFEFDTAQEAEAFAQGNWKDISTHDAEGLDFYQKRGLDYNREKKIYDTYMEATDIMYFLDPDRDGIAYAPFRQENLTEEQKKLLGDSVGRFYIDGKLRNDTQDMLRDAEAVADEYSDDFLNQDSQLAREEFDLYLNKRHQVEAVNAIKLNNQVKAIEDDIVQNSLMEFGVLPEQLIDTTFEDPIQNQRAKNIVQAYDEANAYKEIAADKYYKANTYYDMKHNKNATKEFADNWESFTTEWSGGLARGKAGNVILAGALFPEILGGYDLDDPESTEKMAAKLVQYLSDEPEKVSRVMTRYSMARTSDEISNVIWSDPFEWATSLAAGSISQMLPYGWKIVAGTTATGAGTGAAIGSAGFAGGPTGFATTSAGAVTGATWGFRTGMAATSMAMEYTNEMISAIDKFCRENGSSINDPHMVAEALQHQSVWDEGRRRGLARGIPIATVDLLTAGLAGKMLKVGTIASKSKRVAALAAERAIADPFSEGVGEYLAQVNVGDEINWKEIYAEMGGAMGNNTSNMAINLAKETVFTNNIEKASLLTDLNYLSTEATSDSRISEWGNNMERLGQITAQENKRIQDNVGLRKTANELLKTGRLGRKFQGKNAQAVTTRVMQLLGAKAELSSTTNRKELFGKKIGEINDELNDIITTKSLRPKNEQTILAGTGVLGVQEQAAPTDVRSALPSYSIKKNKFSKTRKVSKEEFLNYVKSLDATRLLKLNASVVNDEETSTFVQEKLLEAKLKNKLNETSAGNVESTESVSVSDGVSTATETETTEAPVEQTQLQSDVAETIEEDGVSSKTLETTEAVVDNQQAAETMETTEVADLESTLQEQESGTQPKVDFRMKTVEETDQEFGPSAEETQDITRQINQQESGNVATEIKSGVTQKIDVEELGNRAKKPFKTVKMSVVKGIPSVFTISDQLTTGDVVNPNTGNTINELKGGLGFTNTEGNEQAAWANTTEKEAADLYVKAERVYNQNKKLFDDWWTANPEYNGLVPMNVVKMGEGSILSNEATFRVLLDNLSKIPAKNKKNALKVLRQTLNKVVADRQKSLKEGGKAESTMKQYTKQLNNAKDALTLLEGAKTIEDVIAIEKIKELTLPARRELIELIGYSQPNRHNETKGVSAPNSAVSKALIDGMGKDARKLINLSVITDLITDKQMAKVPQRSIVAIQGIDVLNGGVIETNHPNYKFGVKGRTIGILDESIAIQDAYGTAFNNALVGLTKAEANPKKVTKKQAEQNQETFDKAQEKIKKKEKLNKKETAAVEEGRLTEGQLKAASLGTILTETIGVQNGLPGLEFIGAIAEGNVDNVNKLVNFMNTAFPSVNISTDSQTFSTVIESEGVKKYLKGDEVIYGVTVDGDVYINPDVHNSQSSIYNTAIHEMGHVWTDYLQTTKQGKKIYKKGAELVQQTEEFKKQLKAFNGDVTKATNEAMAILIGNKGQTIADASIKSKFQEWLLGMWKYIKSQFKLSKDLTAKDIQDMNLDTFLGTALADIFSGKEIKLTDQQLKQLKNPDAAFRQSMSIDSIIQTGRANGFSDASIKVVLQNRGFKAKDIKDAMTVQIDMVTQMPSEFANIEGGVNVGLRLYNEVRNAVNAFSIEGPRGGRGRAGVRTKTFAEVREKAIELLKQNPIWQVQDEQTQMELINAFDRALGIRSNPRVRQQIADIRAKLKQRRIADKNLKEAQRRMRMRIRQLLPKSKNYSNTVINKLLKVINDTTVKNFNGQMEIVLDEVEAQRTVLRNKVILKIQDLVAKKAKTVKTQSGKRRSAGLDAIGQSYFAEVKKVLQAAIKQDMDSMLELQNSIDENLYNEGVQAIEEGRKPTTKQQVMLDRQLALDTFADVLTMNLEDVNALFEEVKKTRGESIARLNNRRQLRKMMTQSIKDSINDQIRKDFQELYDFNGNPLNENQLAKRKDRIRLAFKNNGVFAALSEWGRQFRSEGRKYKVNKLTQFFYNNLAHLGTITNILDRGKKGMFTKVFYENLNNMDENTLEGIRRVTQEMNAITESVTGKTWLDWKYSLGNDIIELDGIINSKTGAVYTEAMNKDQAMRVIALSLNDVQNDKLVEQGFTKEKIDQLKGFVGAENVSIIEQTVDFLSNKYYEQTNAVFSQVNDVNLGFVENYFPTQTLSQSKVTASMLDGNEIQKIFTADFSPALKERTDQKSDVKLGLSFTDVMEEHTKQMEKYKAYALGVKQIDSVLKDEGVKNLLKETGTESIFKSALNYAINPDAGPEAKETIIDVLQRKFTGFALAFKLIQIPKQMTSFIQAYDSYAGGKTKIPGFKLMSFMYDYAKVLAMVRSEIKEAREVSATFDNRIKQGLEGDIYGLESGTRTFKKGTAQQGKRGKFRRGFRKATGLATVTGDILGVLGYKAVYNQAIRNGMSKAEALRLFNDYNATQQTRRATEKNPLQQSKDWSKRFFTMFGSTLFLQQNKVYQSMNSMINDVSRGKVPSSKDAKTFALNYAVANVLFTMASYSASLISGNSDDRDRAMKAIMDAAKGKNLIFQIPLIGAGLEQLENTITGDRKPISEGVNPFNSVIYKVKKAYDGLSSESIIKTAQPFLEIMIGAQVDSPIALIKLLGGDTSEENIMQTIGISKSYRPGYGQKKGKSKTTTTKPKKTSKKDLKIIDEDLYNDLYGKDSEIYQIKQEQRQIKKEIRKEIDEALKM